MEMTETIDQLQQLGAAGMSPDSSAFQEALNEMIYKLRSNPDVDLTYPDIAQLLQTHVHVNLDAEAVRSRYRRFSRAVDRERDRLRRRKNALMVEDPFYVANGVDTVMVIPDTHFPFEHPRSLEFVLTMRDRIKPDLIVHLGDVVDNHALNFHGRELGAVSPEMEIELARDTIAEWAEEIPDLVGLYGNHDKLPIRRMKAGGLTKDMLVSFESFYQMPPGWRWYQQAWIDNVLYIHGTRAGMNPALTEVRSNHRSVVQGHAHQAGGITMLPGAAPPPDSGLEARDLFALNGGCLINPKAYAFNYARGSSDRYVLGVAAIYDRGTRPAYYEMASEDKRVYHHVVKL